MRKRKYVEFSFDRIWARGGASAKSQDNYLCEIGSQLGSKALGNKRVRAFDCVLSRSSFSSVPYQNRALGSPPKSEIIREINLLGPLQERTKKGPIINLKTLTFITETMYFPQINQTHVDQP